MLPGARVATPCADIIVGAAVAWALMDPVSLDVAGVFASSPGVVRFLGPDYPKPRLGS